MYWFFSKLIFLFFILFFLFICPLTLIQINMLGHVVMTQPIIFSNHYFLWAPSWRTDVIVPSCIICTVAGLTSWTESLGWRHCTVLPSRVNYIWECILSWCKIVTDCTYRTVVDKKCDTYSYVSFRDELSDLYLCSAVYSLTSQCFNSAAPCKDAL